MKKLVATAAIAGALALAAPAFSAAKLPNACKLVSAAQYHKVIGADLGGRIHTSEGTSTCIVGLKMVTAVGPATASVRAQMKSGLAKVPGIAVGGFSKTNGGLYAIKGNVLVTMGPAGNVPKAKLVTLMKFALAKL